MQYTSELISGPLTQLTPVAVLALAAILVVVSTKGRLGYEREVGVPNHSD